MKNLLLYFLISVVAFQLSAQRDGFAESNGVNIYYRTFGIGTPILIINGGPGLNSDGFVELAKILSAQNQTIIYDQRGTGRSAMQKTDASTITMQLMIDDMENLRKQLKIERWIILGHSFGGMLASYYATIHPDKIISMILSSSGGIDLELLSYVSKNINARLTPQQLDSANYWSQKITGGDTSYFARLQRARALANAYVYDKKYAPLIAERLTHSNLRVNDLVWQDMQKSNFNCAQKLSTFTRPVLIIQGKEDIIEERISQKANRILKNSKLVILDHCVHYGWLDNRDAYLSEVEKFISGKD
jgi:proline iminopeptidase